VTRGRQVFLNVGCQACHATSFKTATSSFTAPGTGLNQVTFSPLSDFALHDMGAGLADQVSQGAATGTEFRTAPLWGLGQRIFFLHDGRTKDLLGAIQQHSGTGSEASVVINQFNMLSNSELSALTVRVDMPAWRMGLFAGVAVVARRRRALVRVQP
jgi:CxxC motif-containing protein (DUF1111 family)